MQKAILFVIFICCSCVSTYIPTIRNVPQFSERGEFQLSGSLGNGMNVNSAYALTNHLAISVSGLYANNKIMMPEYWRVHQSVEGALGFYANRKKMSFEVFGGYGAGSGYGMSNANDPQDLLMWLFFSIDDVEVSGSYRKIFVQPSIGYRRKRVELVWTLRFSHVDFRSISLTRYENAIEIPKTSFYFWEPSFTAKIFPAKKVPALFVFGQGGVTVHYADSPEFGYSFLHYGIGVGLKLKTSDSDQ